MLTFRDQGQASSSSELFSKPCSYAPSLCAMLQIRLRSYFLGNCLTFIVFDLYCLCNVCPNMTAQLNKNLETDSNVQDVHKIMNFV